MKYADEVHEHASKMLESWFTRTAIGETFLPGDGTALPLSSQEAAAIRNAAIENIASRARAQSKSVKPFQYGVLAVPAVLFLMPFSLPFLLRAIVFILCFLAFVGVIVFVCLSHWRLERGHLVLREAIAFSLRGRVPVPEQLGQPAARREPDYRRLGPIIFGLLGAYLILQAIKIPLYPFFEQLAGTWIDDLAYATDWVLQIAIIGSLLYIVIDFKLAQLRNALAKRRARS